MHQEPRARVTGAELGRDLLEDPDEQLADPLALVLRVEHAGEGLEEPVGRLHVDQVDVELAPEGLLDLLGLAGPHQAGIDEHAGQLVTDRLVDQGGRDRRVHPAAQRAEHPVPADLGPYRLDLGLDDRHVGPGGWAPAHIVGEPGDELGAPGGVHDLGVELDAEDPPVGVPEGGDGRAAAGVLAPRHAS